MLLQVGIEQVAVERVDWSIKAWAADPDRLRILVVRLRGAHLGLCQIGYCLPGATHVIGREVGCDRQNRQISG